MNTTPVQDLVLRIGRRVAKTFTGNGVTQTFSLNEYLYNATNIYSFKAEVNGIVQRPNIDYTFNDSTRNITFGVAPTGTIDISTQSYYNYVETLTPDGLSGGERFGQSISCSTDGRQIMIGCHND